MSRTDDPEVAQHLNRGCGVQLVRGLAFASLLPVFLGLGLILVEVVSGGSRGGGLSTLARVAFSLMDLGLVGFIAGMCAFATVRVKGVLSKALVFVLLWLPLGIPALLAAPIGLWALWFLAP